MAVCSASHRVLRFATPWGPQREARLDQQCLFAFCWPLFVSLPTFSFPPLSSSPFTLPFPPRPSRWFVGWFGLLEVGFLTPKRLGLLEMGACKNGLLIGLFGCSDCCPLIRTTGAFQGCSRDNSDCSKQIKLDSKVNLCKHWHRVNFAIREQPFPDVNLASAQTAKRLRMSKFCCFGVAVTC